MFESHAIRVLAAARAAGDEDWLVDDEGVLTGDDVVRQVTALARWFAAQGLGPGRRVAIGEGISARGLIVRYAAGVAGCASVFLPETPERFAPFLRLVEPDAVALRPELLRGGSAGTRLLRVPAWSEVGDGDDPASPTGAGPADEAVLVSSGGTTGRPKASRRNFARYLGMVEGPVAPDRRQLVCTSLAYVAQVLVDQTLLGGGRVVLQADGDAAAVLRAVERHRITHLGLVEPLLDRLADHAERARHDLSSLVSLSHIGVLAPAPLRRRWLQTFGPILVNPYGGSESGLATTLAAPDYVSQADDRRLNSAGRLLPGAEIRVERADGSVADVGESGQLVVRTPGTAEGYVAAAPSGAFRADGWFASGDLGHVDAAGFLTVRGRAADQRLGAMPVDLELVLYGHEQVRYVVAVPFGDDPERPFGVVVRLAAGSALDSAGLADWLSAQRPTPGCAPAALVVVEAVPVTEQGKPDRTAITALLAASPRLRPSAEG